MINAVTPGDGVMSRSNTLVKRSKPGKTPEEATADMLVSGIPINAVAAVEFSKHPFRDADLAECLVKLYDTVRRVQEGDLGEPEALLTAQAVTLNAIFTDLALKAANTDQPSAKLRLVGGEGRWSCCQQANVPASTIGSVWSSASLLSSVSSADSLCLRARS